MSPVPGSLADVFGYTAVVVAELRDRVLQDSRGERAGPDPLGPWANVLDARQALDDFLERPDASHRAVEAKLALDRAVERMFELTFASERGRSIEPPPPSHLDVGIDR